MSLYIVGCETNLTKRPLPEVEEIRSELKPYFNQGSTLSVIYTDHPHMVGSILGFHGLVVNEEGLLDTSQYQTWTTIRPDQSELARLGKAKVSRIMRMISAIIDPASIPEEIVTFSPAFVANILALEGVRLTE